LLLAGRGNQVKYLDQLFTFGVGTWQYFCASCDKFVEAEHFDREHAAKSYERYFAGFQRWQRYFEVVARTPDVMVAFKRAWREFSGAK